MKIRDARYTKKGLIKLKVRGIIFLLSIILMQMIMPINIQIAAENLPYGYERVTETDNLILYYNKELGNIAIKDQRNGYVWESIVDTNTYDFESANKRWQSNMTSMLVLSCTDMDVGEGNLVQVFSSSDAEVIEEKYIENGIAITYDFKGQEISITLEIELEEDCAVYRIPLNKIVQRGNMGVVSIGLMPFFGAANHETDGYVFYPDGAGALTKYGNMGNRPLEIKEYKWGVYGPENLQLKEYTKKDQEQNYQAMLPVYGIKNGENAILAAVCDGMENTNIRFSPEGFAVGLNRIFFEFTYRHLYNINLSNITIYGESTSKLPVGKRVDKEIIEKDREVRTFFLVEDQANYSGMANIYREYLIQNNQMKKVIKKGDPIPLGLDLFMGIKEERILLDKFIPMTTFSDAINISEEFKKNGVEGLQVILKGWIKGGYGLYPNNWPPERRLGGKTGLEKYAAYAYQNNIQLFLENNFIRASSKGGGFSLRKDVVMQGSNVPVTDLGEKYFLLNPFSAASKLSNLLRSLRGIEGVGIGLEDMGQMIYHDYNKFNPFGRVETAEKWAEIMSSVEREGRNTAVEGGNLYSLRYTDRLYNIPLKSSGYHITDETVPFYQMVVHGMVPYTSYPGNLSSNLTATKLKWVEYGCMPYFELTNKKSVDLKNTDYNTLFTSYYGDWLETATEIYKEFNNRLKGLWEQAITSHEKMDEDVYKVKYGNGDLIYINYSKRDIVCEGYTVKAQDYLVVEEGGIVR